MTRLRCLPLTAMALAIGVSAAPSPAAALEHVKVATTFLGLWDTSQPTFCADRGEFTKAGLDVEVVSTRGGTENVQAVIAGGADIGFSPGLNAVLAAYMQGAKIKLLSSEFIGQNQTFFYVLADSPIRTIDDLKGKSVAYPRPGGSSEAVLLGLKAERHMDFTAVATGAADATLTLAMTKQIDVGYSVPPTALAEAEKGQVRVLFSGDDVEAVRDITGNVVIASDDFATKRRATAIKFMQVLDQCIDWAYANISESSKPFAAMNKIDDHIAARSIAFYKRSALAFGPIHNMGKAIDLAVVSKTIDKAPTEDQLKGLVDILYTTGKQP